MSKEIEEQIKALEQLFSTEVKKIKEEVSQQNKEKSKYYKLQVNELGENLAISFPVDGLFYIIGCVLKNGQCYILDTEKKVKNYEEWRDNGCKVDSTPFVWRGEEYYIDHNKVLRSQSGFIYDFFHCRPVIGCLDDNIIRHKHNNCPILF